MYFAVAFVFTAGIVIGWYLGLASARAAINQLEREGVLEVKKMKKDRRGYNPPPADDSGRPDPPLPPPPAPKKEPVHIIVESR